MILVLVQHCLKKDGAVCLVGQLGNFVSAVRQVLNRQN